MSGVAIRLTSLAHGGGCGCKLAPAVLQELLADQPVAPAFSSLLVGSETGDDAAVHGMTDVTGFGLLGHGHEMARGASVAQAHADRVLRTISEAGYPSASIVGRAESGTPGIRVTGALARARR